MDEMICETAKRCRRRHGGFRCRLRHRGWIVANGSRDYDKRMWEQYRKSFVRSQLLILVIVALLVFYAKSGWQTAAAALVLMQVAGVIGAWWGARLKRKILAQRD